MVDARIVSARNKMFTCTTGPPSPHSRCAALRHTHSRVHDPGRGLDPPHQRTSLTLPERGEQLKSDPVSPPRATRPDASARRATRVTRGRQQEMLPGCHAQTTPPLSAGSRPRHHQEAARESLPCLSRAAGFADSFLRRPTAYAERLAPRTRARS